MTTLPYTWWEGKPVKDSEQGRDMTGHRAILPRVPCGIPQTSNLSSTTGTPALPFELCPLLVSFHLHTFFSSHSISRINARLSSIVWHYFKNNSSRHGLPFKNAFFHTTEHAFREVTRGHFYWSKCVSCSQHQSPVTVMFLFQKVSLLCQQQPFKTQSYHMILFSMQHQ